ncbi:MAG: ABC transporter, phosphonate, periplasmic substrate-binding family protein [Acidimicrobiaceae bacterium]|nr:MAG: ABC transporter, phosphonate, periplasmic substrate-binding family protein [Acidimicrobiaceae bacterium]
MASIDSVSWVHIQRFAPELVAGVVEVGSGPLVPAPPVVASATTTDDELTAIRLAMAEAFHDDAARTAMAGALMGGFVPLELADYISLRALRPGPAAG